MSQQDGSVRAGVRKRVTLLVMLAAAASLWAAPSRAEDYPVRRVTIVAPVPPGGPMDYAARMMARALERRWHQSVIVENRPGAGALLGAEVVAHAPPDGYTLLIHNTSIAAYPVFEKTDFRFTKDLAAVSTIMQSPWLLFASSEMPGSLNGIIKFAKDNPNKLNIGVIPNSFQQLRTFKFLKLSGISGTMIPYPGTAPVQMALLADQLQLYMASPFGMEKLVSEGKIRAIVALAEQPYWGMPDVPTAAAAGIPFVVGERYYLLAPAKTPAPVIDQLAAAVADAVADPQVAGQIKATGYEPYAESPAEVTRELTALQDEAVDLAQQANITK